MAKVVYLADAEYGPYELAINRGSRDGIKLGQKYHVFGYGPELNDPDTGESLGRIELVRGRGEIVHVQDHIATLRSIERRPERRGKRIIRDSSIAALVQGRGPIVEEEWPADEMVPFVNVSVGDLVKPI